MKALKSITALLVLGLITFHGFAQEVDLTKGDLSFLKGETSINIEFTFEKFSVGDFGKEQDYVKKRRDEQNAKEAGTGDTWAKKWEDDKTLVFGPKFILGFSKENKLTISKDAKYTLIFNTTALEPGYSIGVSKKNAGVDGNVWIVETANKTKKLAVLYVERAPENMFRGAAFDAASRIGDAYFLNGKKVGAFLKKSN